jgi:hypothetical protein
VVDRRHLAGEHPLKTIRQMLDKADYGKASLKRFKT